MQYVRETLSYNPSVEKYENEYRRYLKDYEGISNKSELIKKIITSDLVYHGDYHTLKQSQRSVFRILRDIYEKRKIALCLEMFNSSDQKFIDAFLSGELSENTFLNRIQYKKKWPFSWRNFRPMVVFCKENQIPIIGINTQEGEGHKRLRNRDKHAARMIVKTTLRYSKRLIYIVDGDFHISPNHLPKEVNKLFKLLDHHTKQLIIYQNAENLYWKLCREGKEESDVLKINDTSYCIMNTMPANKVQSYLNWLDYSEDAYYPVHWEWEDESFESQGITIQEMIKTISSILQIDLPENAMDKLSIHYANNFHLIDIIHDIPGIKGKKRLIKEKIKREEGFLIEYSEKGITGYLIYLANSNINMAAEEASHFVNAVLRGPLKKRMSAFDSFYRNAITECLGFFGSKFINEKRKSHSEYSLRKFLGQLKKGEYIKIDPTIPQIARYMLQHYYLQQKNAAPHEFLKKFHDTYTNPTSLPNIFSTQLGYILGNKLYYAVKRGRFPVSKIRELYRNPFDKKGEAFYSFLEISNKIRQIKSVSQF